MKLWKKKNITISILPQLCYLHSRILITILSPIIFPSSSYISITIRNLYHIFHRKLNWTYFSPKKFNRKYNKTKILNKHIIFSVERLGQCIIEKHFPSFLEWVFKELVKIAINKDLYLFQSDLAWSMNLWWNLNQTVQNNILSFLYWCDSKWLLLLP